MMSKSGGDNWDDLMTMVTQGVEVEGIETGGTLSNTLRSTLAGLAVNQFGANVTANNVLSRGSGNILNSNKELLFDGVNLREFRFDVTFTAREQKEGERIKKIIRSLKQEHFYLEGQVCLVVPQEDNNLVVYSSTQHF